MRFKKFIATEGDARSASKAEPQPPRYTIFRQRIREGEHHSQPVRLYGLKIGAIHRNRFAARMAELLEMAAMPELSVAIEPLVRMRETCALNGKLRIDPSPLCRAEMR
jgi:hypothetical protein